MIEIRKVLAYITRDNQLLVFTHPLSPEAGIQVPAGTIEAGETPEKAVVREAQEETGITGLERVSFLGEYKQDMTEFGKQELHHRFFYHLICTQPTPNEWRHGEYDPSDSEDGYIPFDFYWVDLPDGVPVLAGNQGKMVNRL